MTHLEQFPNTDSQLKKCEEIKDWHAIIQYWLRLSLQLENHDPVNVTWCLNEFTSTISKLCLIIENSLDKDDDRQVKTCFKAFCLKVENDIKVLSLQNMTIN